MSVSKTKKKRKISKAPKIKQNFLKQLKESDLQKLRKKNA